MKRNTSILKPTAILVLLLAVMIGMNNLLNQRNHLPLSADNTSISTGTNPKKTPIIGPSKVIFLTLDMDMSEWMHERHVDGYVGTWYDPDLISYLIKNNIPATFFVSGLFAETYPDIIERLNSTGNYFFQNHSYDESSFTPNCYQLETLTTDQEKISQIRKTQDILKNLTGQTPTQFRFPGNCQNAANDQLVQSLGFVINNGSIIAGDPFNSDTDAIVNAVLSQAKDNSVILMHVGGPDAPKSLDALEKIVPALEKEGYVFIK